MSLFTGLFYRLTGRKPAEAAPAEFEHQSPPCPPEAPPPPPAEPGPRSSELPVPPPLVAAMLGKPNDAGAVQVHPPGERMHAPNFTVESTLLSPEEVDAYCRATPIHRNRIAPPAGTSFADAAVFDAVLRAIPEHTRAELYAKGGIPLINETVMEAVARLKAAEKK